jgi:GxxExxY protein
VRENEISGTILDAAYRTHKALGPGLLESIYEEVLSHELKKKGVEFLRQHAIPITHDGLELGTAFKADLVVEGKVIVEVKAVEALHAIHRTQLLTYLRLANKHLGLLINFNTVLIKDGVHRIVNNLPEPHQS